MSGSLTWSPPNFHQDNNVNDLSNAEAQAITQNWRRAAEDLAPFNINVTTVDPNNFANQQGLRVAISGLAAGWFGDAAANGDTQQGGFSTALSNTAFVFSGTIGANFQNIAGPLLLAPNGTVTDADWISFKNTTNNPSNGGALKSRLLGISLNDGDGGTSLEVFQTVNII